MPGTYAHYAFGKKVLEQVDVNIAQIITNNLDLFFIGLHGPDIFFYYKPILYKNPISQIGPRIHNEKATAFFQKCKDIIINSKLNDKNLAYTFGFLCHFMLDSECHPYINKIAKEKNISHTHIESEFDKLLIYNEGKNPFSIDLTLHINPNITLARTISLFFNVDSHKILKSLKSMKFYNSLFNTSNNLTRFIIFLSLKITFLYKKLYGVFFLKQEDTKCKDICLNIETLYNNAISKTSSMLNNYYFSIKNNTPLPQRLNRTFE